MADDQEWMKRRQRVAKCKAHGLHYDPELTAGCVLCRKEGLDAAPRTRPQLIVLLLAILGMVVLLSRFFDNRSALLLPAAETQAQTSEARATRAGRLDPNAFRSALEAVERALFETPGDDLEAIRDQIAYSLRQLNRKLNASTGASTAAAVAAVDELMERIYLLPLSLDALQEQRDAWLKLRSEHFGRAMWFKIPAAIDPRTDRAALTTYQQVLSDLMSLLDEGSSRARELSQPVAPNFADPEAEARNREEWSRYQTDWQARMSALREELPARPGAGADPKILVAAQKLESVFSRLPSLGSSGVPAPGQIDQVAAAAEEARRSFEELLDR